MSLTSRLVEAQRRALPPGPSSSGLPAREPKLAASSSTLDPSVSIAAERLLGRELPLFQVERAARLAMRGRATSPALRGSAVHEAIVTPLPFRTESVVEPESPARDVAAHATESDTCPSCGAETQVLRIDLVDNTATRECSGCGLIRLTHLDTYEPHAPHPATSAPPVGSAGYDDVNALDA